MAGGRSRNERAWSTTHIYYFFFTMRSPLPIYYYYHYHYQNPSKTCKHKNSCFYRQAASSSFFSLSFCIPFIILELLSPSLPVVIQIRGHIVGPSLPSPLRCMPSFLSREVSSTFLPSSSCVELYLPTLLGALSLVDPFVAFIFANIFKISPRWESNSTCQGRTLEVVFEGDR